MLAMYVSAHRGHIAISLCPIFNSILWQDYVYHPDPEVLQPQTQLEIAGKSLLYIMLVLDNVSANHGNVQDLTCVPNMFTSATCCCSRRWQEEVVVALLHPTRQPNGQPEFRSHLRIPEVLVATKLFTFHLMRHHRDGDQIRYYKPNHILYLTLTKCFFVPKL